MKVLRFSPEFNLGKEMNRGLSLNLFYLVRELQKLGVKQYTYTPTTNSDKYNDIKITRIKQRDRFSMFFLGLDCYNVIKDSDFDLIHTHNYGFFTLYHYKKKLNVPMVHSIHGNPLDFFYQKPRDLTHLKEMFYAYYFTKYICKKADAIVALCDEYRDDIVNKLHVQSEKVHYIPTQVDASLFKPKKFVKDIDVLYAGRFTSIKLVPMIVRIVYYLSKLKPNIRVVLIGGVKYDNDYNQVISLVKNYSLDRNIEIIPPIHHSELVNYYNRSKVCIFLVNPPGIGKTALEAMACGLPIVTNVQARSGLCNLSGREGLVGLKLDPRYIAYKINDLLENNKIFMKRCGRYNRDKILKYFTPEVTSKKLFDIYVSLLEK